MNSTRVARDEPDFQARVSAEADALIERYDSFLEHMGAARSDISLDEFIDAEAAVISRDPERYGRGDGPPTAGRRLRAVGTHERDRPKVSPRDLAIEPGADFLARDKPPVRMLVDELISMSMPTLLVAERKAGKTRLVHNLVRAVCDRETFLARYVTTRPSGCVILLDTEMHESLLDEWLTAQGIRNNGRWAIKPMAGRAELLDLRDMDVLRAWVKTLRASECGYLIVDCLAPICRALGIDENSARELGPLINGFARLADETGCGLLLVHHTGWNGNHARGTSDLEGWPADILYLRNADGARFLDAAGRTVTGFHEVCLEMDDRGRLEATETTRADVSDAKYLDMVPDEGLVVGQMWTGRAAQEARAAYKRLEQRGDVCFHITGRNHQKTIYRAEACASPDDHKPEKHKITVES